MNDLQQQVKNISQQGRFGDTTLVHMNPAEVRGLAQMGQLTTNPNTGLAEAFNLGDVIGIAAPIVGGVFGGPLGAALASGAVTSIQEGSLKEGLKAGLLSYGLGSAFRAAGAAAKGAEGLTSAVDDAVLKAGMDTTTDLVTKEAVDKAAQTALTSGADNIASEAFKKGATSLTNMQPFTMEGFKAGASEMFGTPFAGQGPLQAVGNVAQGLTDPRAFLPLSAVATEAAYSAAEEDMQQGITAANEDRERRRLQAFMDNPEPVIFSASGGLTQFANGGDTDNEDIVLNVPQRQTLAISPDFKAGFQPEMMYFNPATINPSYAALTNQPPNQTLGPVTNANLDTSALNTPEYITENITNNTDKFVPTGNKFLGMDLGALMANSLTAQAVDPYTAYTGVEPPQLLDETTRTMAEGGDTDLPNPGLEALQKVAPDVVKDMGYQEGGMTDDLMTETIAFILGESDDETVVEKFIEMYGAETYMQLRDTVLKEITNPQAQTSGLIEGQGNGGMDDDLLGTIGGKEAIAVSQDEFIVPADVVSMLGDGSSDAGANKLYKMMDDVRTEKTGTTKQASRINDQRVMPT